MPQENVPFFHTLAKIVVARQGYGMESLSTLFFLFGISSVLVGALFYLLGHFDLGRVVYFFPNHVLVGCIGGIGKIMVAVFCRSYSNTKTSDCPHLIHVGYRGVHCRFSPRSHE